MSNETNTTRLPSDDLTRLAASMGVPADVASACVQSLLHHLYIWPGTNLGGAPAMRIMREALGCHGETLTPRQLRVQKNRIVGALSRCSTPLVTQIRVPTTKSFSILDALAQDADLSGCTRRELNAIGRARQGRG